MGNLRVKEILKEKGVSQKYLAEKMGVAEISLSRSINGNPSLETLQKIANTLEISITNLFEQPSKDYINCPNCGVKLRLEK